MAPPEQASSQLYLHNLPTDFPLHSLLRNLQPVNHWADTLVEGDMVDLRSSSSKLDTLPSCKPDRSLVHTCVIHRVPLDPIPAC